MRGVSVVIKAYNEAEKIDAAIASAWEARHEALPWSLEVIVADGLSEDTTVTQAARWCAHAPVRVVQLARAQDRGCGAGVELGHAWATGRWVLLMDGDMVLQPGFLHAALERLQACPKLAGVGGRIEDLALRNGTDRIRQRNRLGSTSGPRPWLEGGGLYRREALQSAGGYAGDARLVAYEEADLGLRLRRQGWTLERLDIPAMLHDGHTLSTPRLLLQRWRTGRAQAAGRLLRLHLGRRGSSPVLRLLAHPLLLGAGWLMLPLLLWLSDGHAGDTATLAAGATVGATLVQWARKGDAAHVLTAWADWHLLLAGIVVGLLSPMPPRPSVPASRLVCSAEPV